MFESLTKTDLLALRENSLAQVALIDRLLKKMPKESRSEKEEKEIASAKAYAAKRSLKRYGKTA